MPPWFYNKDVPNGRRRERADGMNTREELQEIFDSIIDEARELYETEEEARAVAAMRAVLIHMSRSK